MTISKWVNLIFAGVFLVAFVTLDKTFFWVWENAEWSNFGVLGRYVTLTRLIALVGGIGFTFWLYRRPNSFSYMSEVVAELKKVHWPTLDETKRSTLVVIGFTIILSGFLAGFDWIWNDLTDFLFVTGV